MKVNKNYRECKVISLDEYVDKHLADGTLNQRKVNGQIIGGWHISCKEEQKKFKAKQRKEAERKAHNDKVKAVYKIGG